MNAIGHTTWAFADGHIPLASTGPEPEFTSHDKLCLLNAGDHPARVEIMVYFSDREALGPYTVELEARRVRHVRFNDLIDPQALPLDEPYGAVIRASVPIIVQVSRRDTSREANSLMTTMAFPVPEA